MPHETMDEKPYVKIRAVDPATGGLTNPVFFRRTPQGLVRIEGGTDLWRRLDASQLPFDEYTGTEGLTFAEGTPKIVNQQLVIEPSSDGVTPSGGRLIPGETVGGGTVVTPGTGVSGQAGQQGQVTGQPVGQGQQFTPAQSAQVINTQTEENAQLDSLLADSNLTEDQRQAIKAIFNTVSANDQERANQLQAAFKAAAQINEPFFAQQVKLALDELQRGFVSIDQDLAFKEQSIRNRLSDLQQDLASSREFLSLEQQQALKQLERQYKLTLDNTREDLARRGFTASTRRAEAETLLEEQTGELRESAERQFGARMQELQRQGERGDRDAQAELARLQELAAQERTGLARRGEAALGSQQLGPLPPGTQPLGGLTGTIEQEKLASNLQASQQFVF